MHDPVHCREVFFVPTSRLGWTDTAVSIRHKMATPFTTGQERLYRRGIAHQRIPRIIPAMDTWQGSGILPIWAGDGQGQVRFSWRHESLNAGAAETMNMTRLLQPTRKGPAVQRKREHLLGVDLL